MTNSIYTQINRDRFIDVLKAMAIMSLVVGNAPCTPIISRFFSSFSVLLFFFIAGYTFNEESVSSASSLGKYVLQKTLKNAVFFAVYACVLFLIDITFAAVGVINAEEFYRGNILETFGAAAEKYLMSPMWIIPALLICGLVFAVLVFLTHRLKLRDVANAAIFIASLAAVFVVYKRKISLPFNIQSSLLGFPVMMVANYCRKYKSKLEKYVTWYGAIIVAVLIAGILKYTGGTVDISENAILSLRFIYPVTMLGVYFCVEIAKEIDRGQAARFFAYIGEANCHILALYLFFFKLTDVLYTVIIRPEYTEGLAEFPTGSYCAGIIYAIVGILLPIALVRLFETINAKSRKKEPQSLKFAKRFFKETLLNTVVCALPVFTALFFSPMEIFLGNPIDFEFTLENIWWILLIQALLLSFFIAFFVCAVSQKHRWILTACVFAGGICSYVQALLLNGQMVSLDGESTGYSIILMLTNLIVWAVIAAAIIALYYVFAISKRKVSGKMICVYVSCAIIIMQTTGLCSLLLSGNEYSEARNSFFLSKNGEFELSCENNLVVFIIDTCDGYYVDMTLAEDPGLFDDLNGFTYYPDATSVYSRTYPGVPYLLTQQECYFDLPFNQYVSKAYDKSDFWLDLTTYSDDVRIFTSINYVSSGASESIKNVELVEKGALSNLNVNSIADSSKDVGIYRVAPYFAKGLFEYSLSDINYTVAHTNKGEAYSDDDVLFCRDVLDQSLTITNSYSNALRFYHLFGTHPGNYLDEECRRTNSPSVTQTLRGNFKMINSYLDQMRELGVYDNSTIIITADHGNSLSGDHLARETATTTIMLVKPAGAENEPCKISYAQVGQEDWFATAIEALGGDSSKYGRTFTEIPEGEERTRTYFYTALYSDIDGEVALREYNITGDSRAFANWHLTGRNWNVDYSERAVSEARLTDEYPDAVILPAP